jgi:hypothetical protein
LKASVLVTTSNPSRALNEGQRDGAVGWIASPVKPLTTVKFHGERESPRYTYTRPCSTL